MQPGDVSLLASLSTEYGVKGESPSFMPADAFNKLLRERAEPRGGRFSHDHPDTCMYIERSKNLNVVAYTANLMNGPTQVASGVGCACHLKADDPIHAYFINIEPSYLEERRRKGIAYDCDDLKVHERMFAYGCNVVPLSSVISTAAAGRGSPTQWLHKLHQGAKEAVSNPAKIEELKWTVDPVKAEAILGHVMTTASTLPNGSAAQAGTEAGAAAAELTAWWTALRPALCHFVALPTWPGVLLCLPPLTQGAEGTAAPPPPPPEEAAVKTPESAEPQDKGTTAAASTATSRHAAPADTFVVILAVVDHKLSILNRVYVKSIEPKRFYQLPSVEYIEAFGTSLETGEPTYEKKMNT